MTPGGAAGRAKLKVPVALGAAALTALLIYFFRQQVWLAVALPTVLVLGIAALWRPVSMLYLLAFATPLSVNLEELNMLGGVGIYLPTEPMLLGLLFLSVLQGIILPERTSGFLGHPLSLAILFNLAILFITACTSTMPVVSFKFFLARLWFVGVMYFFLRRFAGQTAFVLRFFRFYIAGMALVIGYTLVRHWMHGFEEEPAHWVMTPFFKDHTSYGAILALLYPLVLYFTWRARNRPFALLLWSLIALLFTMGLVFSYTRAAWVSLVLALATWILIKLRIDWRLLGLGAAISLGALLAFENQLTDMLDENRQDSSGDFSEHVQSVSNISTDASNLERLNRWASALRMFEEKPLLGFGPGTYMFQYATFQKSSEKTIISTNLAEGGNAHSEYLGPLSESGIFGLLSILAVFAISLVTGIRLYYRLPKGSLEKGLVLCMVLGLVTYYGHGALNNYLDTDKASVPLWAMMCVLVCFDLSSRRSLQSN